jgi:peroxidase
MHNLWIRQHNKVVDGLKRVNQHWLPEQLYQEARKIVGAQMQVITYDAWLPYILGPTGMRMLGKWERYDEHIDPTISNEFATAAFRCI